MYDDLKRKQGYQKSFTLAHLIISIFYIYPQILSSLYLSSIIIYHMKVVLKARYFV